MGRLVLLYGPYIISKKVKNAYGGGTGGYTRNMITYINYFKSDKATIIPSFHTFRGQLKLDNFIWRFIVDTCAFLKDILNQKPNIIHILGQYRTAIPREFMVVFISSLFCKKVIYELKAGAFIDWYLNTNIIFKWMTKYIIAKSDCILSEGKKYLPFIEKEFEKNALYFPNYIPSDIIPNQPIEILTNKILNILFVGYCYEGKGIFELVKGCNIAAVKGLEIELTLIGQEHEDFTKWLDSYDVHENLTIIRRGRQPYEEVLTTFPKNDIYCYPTLHKGEGHNNTINEAMMFGLAIITTKQGFLEDIITGKTGYSINDIQPDTIASILGIIDNDRQNAKSKAQEAHRKLRSDYSSEKLYRQLVSIYENI